MLEQRQTFMATISSIYICNCVEKVLYFIMYYFTTLFSLQSWRTIETKKLESSWVDFINHSVLGYRDFFIFSIKPQIHRYNKAAS